MVADAAATAAMLSRLCAATEMAEGEENAMAFGADVFLRGVIFFDAMCNSLRCRVRRDGPTRKSDAVPCRSLPSIMA